MGPTRFRAETGSSQVDRTRLVVARDVKLAAVQIAVLAARSGAANQVLQVLAL